MSIKKWLLGASTVIVTGALVAGGATAASADPSGAPTFRILAGSGSDTTQDLNNGLAAVVQYNPTFDNPATPGDDFPLQQVLGSYNAVNPGPGGDITTKSGVSFLRPNGSSQGVNALKSAKGSTLWDGENLPANALQFARSSSPATFVSNGAYSYVPLALDAVSYAKNPAGEAPGNIPLGGFAGQDSDGDTILDLTLRNIFTRNATTTLETSTGATFTVGNQASNADIVPFKPQAGSGTLTYWTTTMGSLGSIVADTYTDSTGSNSVQEHDGSVTAAVTNAIVPFSVAQHIAQSNAVTLSDEEVYDVDVTDRREGSVLGSVDGESPTVGTPATLNTSFNIVRPVFTVVQYAELKSNTVEGETLRAVFEGSSALAYEATRPGGVQLTVEDFGFGDITGGVTINGVTYTAGDTASFRAN